MVDPIHLLVAVERVLIVLSWTVSDSMDEIQYWMEVLQEAVGVARSVLV